MSTKEVKPGPKDATEDSVSHLPFTRMMMPRVLSYSGRYSRNGGAGALIYFSGAVRCINSYLPLPSLLPISPRKEDKAQEEAEA